MKMDRFEKRDLEARREAEWAYHHMLVDALSETTIKLKAAISLLENTPQANMAAPSNKMFAEMIASYKKAVEQGIAALARF
jgi:hypothetical protein